MLVQSRAPRKCARTLFALEGFDFGVLVGVSYEPVPALEVLLADVAHILVRWATWLESKARTAHITWGRFIYNQVESALEN
jgi:hypothetical protein